LQVASFTAGKGFCFIGRKDNAQWSRITPSFYQKSNASLIVRQARGNQTGARKILRKKQPVRHFPGREASRFGFVESSVVYAGVYTSHFKIADVMS